jgi:cAMP-dependent protein kinase regulator
MPGKNIPNQEYLKQKRGSVFHKAFECGSQAAKFVPPVHEKQDEDTQRLVDLFKNSFLTKNIDEKEHKTLANAMFQKKFKAGDPIIRYGDIGSEYYVLANGTVNVTVYQPGTNPFDPKIDEKVSFKKELKAEAAKAASEGGMIGFGEIALLYNDKRTASVTAVTECETWVLTGECFKYIIAQNSIRRRNISLEFLNKVELFNVLEQYEKVKLIDGLKVSQYGKGEYVFHEGDRGDHFYIIEEGEIECGNESEAGEFSHVRTLSAGSHFGEIAIIKGVRRTLSVRVSGDRVKLLVLTRDTFNRILGSIKAYLKEDYKKDHELDSSFTSDHSGNHAHAVKAKEDKSLFKI